MSKVILKVEVDEEAYKQIKGDSVYDNNNKSIVSKSSSAYYALNAIINATQITESDDAVSRQAVIAEMRSLYPDIPLVDFNNARLKWVQKYKPYLDCEKVVKNMPPVLPKREQGEWCEQNDDYFDWYECSECGYGSEGEMQYSSEHDVRTKYCPNCGAEMR